MFFTQQELNAHKVAGSPATATTTAATNLSLPVHADQAACRFVGGSDEYRVSTDPVHEDADRRLQVIHVNVSVLCDHEHYAVFWGNLGRQQRLRCQEISWRRNACCKYEALLREGNP